MSYTITIGNAIFTPQDITDEEGNVLGVELRARIKEIKNLEAPYFTDSEYTNVRSPGYSQMRHWCELAGPEVVEMWYNKQNGFLKQHPGIVKLEPHHLETMKKALEQYKTANPTAIPQMENRTSPTFEQDCVLARLVWYSWWFEWALNNCENPAVSNS